MTGDAVSASIAHEIKQPLSGIVTNAEACLRWLARSMPDQVKTTLEQIVADGHHAGVIIDGVRAHRGAGCARGSPPLEILAISSAKPWPRTR
jgi:C4-dicarboxylate-specific signal transduction histidine kinase